jgi:uncharacterized protein
MLEVSTSRLDCMAMNMLVLQHLLDALHTLDQSGLIPGCVTVVPFANPIGMSQRFFGPVVGRFDFENGENFNRNFPLMRTAVEEHVQSTDATSVGRAEWKRLFRKLTGSKRNLSPAGAMKQALVRLSIEHDIVLDLHCATNAIAHIYVSDLQRKRAVALARFLDAPVVMLEPAESGGGAFDQTHSSAWGALQNANVFTEEQSGFSATVELRGHADVSDELAREDAHSYAPCGRP